MNFYSLFSGDKRGYLFFGSIFFFLLFFGQVGNGSFEIATECKPIIIERQDDQKFAFNKSNYWEENWCQNEGPNATMIYGILFNLNLKNPDYYYDRCKDALICYEPSHIKPQYKVVENNNISKRCGNGKHGIEIKMCHIRHNQMVYPNWWDREFDRPFIIVIHIKTSFMKEGFSNAIAYHNKVVNDDRHYINERNLRIYIFIQIQQQKINIYYDDDYQFIKHNITNYYSGVKIDPKIQLYNGLMALQKLESNLNLLFMDLFDEFLLRKNDEKTASLCYDYNAELPHNFSILIMQFTGIEFNSTNEEANKQILIKEIKKKFNKIHPYSDKTTPQPTTTIVDETILPVSESFLSLPIEASNRTTIPEYINPSTVEENYLPQNRSKRQISKEMSIWKLPIHYKFEIIGIVDWRNLIREAIKMITEETCIEFVEHADLDQLYNMPYLYFSYGISTPTGSDTGRIVKEGPQTITVKKGEKTPNIAHEILHALGIFHEQSRWDRDEHIWMNWKYIEEKNRLQFQKIDTLQFGMPYDFGSIMHFSADALSANPKKYSIITRGREYQHTIGQRQKLSFKDAKLINLLYKCEEKCPWNKRITDCENGGYMDPKKCDVCKCPVPFEGTKCHQKCENYKIAKKEEQIVEFDSSKNAKCFRTLLDDSEKNADHIVEVSVKNLEILDSGQNCQMVCQETYIEIKAWTDKAATGARLCCKESVEESPIKIEAEMGAEVDIIFKGKVKGKIAFKSKLADHIGRLKNSCECKEPDKEIWWPDRNPDFNIQFPLDQQSQCSMDRKMQSSIKCISSETPLELKINGRTMVVGESKNFEYNGEMNYAVKGDFFCKMDKEGFSAWYYLDGQKYFRINEANCARHLH